MLPCGSLFRLLLDPSSEAGGGGIPDAPTQQFQRLLDTHGGDGVKAARQLFDENHQLRGETRSLKGKLPKEGSRVLTPEEATELESYRGLGKVAELKSGLAARDEAVAQVARFERSKVIASSATLAGFDAEVLESLAPADAVFGMKEETIKGKVVKTPTITPKGGKEQPLGDFAAKEWPKFLPSLRQQQDGKTAASETAPPIGTPRHDGQAQRPDFSGRPKPGEQTPTREQALRATGAYGL